ncbi:MAG: C40 family peptidase [Bacteroidota bacterium]
MSQAIDYGVCRLAIVTARKEADQKSEPVTQLLFGDHYEVVEFSKDQKWLSVIVNADNSEGWIDRLQHHAISKEYHEQIGLANFKITTDIASTMLYKKSQLTIVMGSIVPISASELFKMEEQFAFNGETKSLGQRRDFEFLKSIACKYLNAPHFPGGKSPFGIDAPGFTQMSFRLAGYQLPRDVQQQWNHTKPAGDTLPGDLVFFKDKHEKINHVGILLDEQKIIHCSGKVRIDILLEEGIFVAETKLYTHSLAGFRRVLA